MTIALTLLVTALQLKLALLGLPAEYKSTVDQMMPIVETAISTANAEIAKGERVVVVTPTVVQNTPVLPQPSFGSIITPMEDKSDIVITLVSQNSIDEVNNMPYGGWNYKVAVLDKDGKNIKDASITMTAQDNIYPEKTRNADAISATGMNDWTGSFGFVPTSKGSKQITFTSNGITKNIIVDVN